MARHILEEEEVWLLYFCFAKGIDSKAITFLRSGGKAGSPVFKGAADASRAGTAGGRTMAAAQQGKDPGSGHCQPLFISLPLMLVDL